MARISPAGNRSRTNKKKAIARHRTEKAANCKKGLTKEEYYAQQKTPEQVKSEYQKHVKPLEAQPQKVIKNKVESVLKDLNKKSNPCSWKRFVSLMLDRYVKIRAAHSGKGTEYVWRGFVVSESLLGEQYSKKAISAKLKVLGGNKSGTANPETLNAMDESEQLIHDKKHELYDDVQDFMTASNKAVDNA